MLYMAEHLIISEPQLLIVVYYSLSYSMDDPYIVQEFYFSTFSPFY